MWVEQGAVGQKEGEKRTMSFEGFGTRNWSPEKWAWCHARYDVFYMPLVLLIPCMAAFTSVIHDMHQPAAIIFLCLSLLC